MLSRHASVASRRSLWFFLRKEAWSWIDSFFGRGGSKTVIGRRQRKGGSGVADRDEGKVINEGKDEMKKQK